MKKILMTTVLTTALFLGATTAQAECPCQHKDKKMPPPPPRFEKMHKSERKNPIKFPSKIGKEALTVGEKKFIIIKNF